MNVEVVICGMQEGYPGPGKPRFRPNYLGSYCVRGKLDKYLCVCSGGLLLYGMCAICHWISRSCKGALPLF